MELNTIKKGFNQGYDLKRLHPELAEKLYRGFTALSSKNEYQSAFLNGYEQAEIEQAKTHIKRRHFQVSKHDLDKIDKSKDKDKGDREL